MLALVVFGGVDSVVGSGDALVDALYLVIILYLCSDPACLFLLLCYVIGVECVSHERLLPGKLCVKMCAVAVQSMTWAHPVVIK